MHQKIQLSLAVIAIALAGCGSDPGTVPDRDAGSNPVDAGTNVVDSAVTLPDAGQPDAGQLDAGQLDTGMADAGEPDAGQPDAGQPDAGQPDSGPPPPDDTACDDVFSGALRCNAYNESAPGWKPDDDNSTIGLSMDQAYRGAQSLFVETTATDEQVFVQQGWGGAVTSGTLYARGYFYFPAVTDPDFDDWRLLYLQENASPWQLVGVRLDGAYVPRLYVNTVGGGNQTASSSIPTDQWVCIQLTVDVASTGGSAQLHVDGALAAEVTDINTLPAGGLSHMMTGIGRGGAGQATSVYLDELVVDTSPTPCD